MKRKKTIPVEYIREQANSFFLRSANDRKSARINLQFFVADILMKTENYKGFGYLSKSDVTPGLTFGVDRDTVPHSFPDDSRIFFY